MSIKKLLKKGFKNIWKSRWLFLIMFFTQIAFLVVLSYAGIVYYIGAVEHATAMLESVENITAEQIAGMQIPEPYKIYEHYKGMVYNVLMGIIMVYIAFLFLDGINWNLANAIVNRTRHLKDSQPVFDQKVYDGCYDTGKLGYAVYLRVLIQNTVRRNDDFLTSPVFHIGHSRRIDT